MLYFSKCFFYSDCQPSAVIDFLSDGGIVANPLALYVLDNKDDAGRGVYFNDEFQFIDDPFVPID